MNDLAANTAATDAVGATPGQPQCKSGGGNGRDHGPADVAPELPADTARQLPLTEGKGACSRLMALISALAPIARPSS
jgi:hypothetical protein